MEILQDRMRHAGLTLVANSGETRAASLAVAMMQLAGLSDEEAAPRARHLLHPSILDDRLLIQAGGALVWPAGNAPPVVIMQANPTGAPRLHDPLREAGDDEVAPASLAHGTLVLLEHEGRLSAVANTSGRPWSLVLEQMNEPPGLPGYTRHLAEFETLRRHERPVVLSSVSVDGVQQHDDLRRGGQRQLTPFPVDREATPLRQARSAAVAQNLVDHFWNDLAVGDVNEAFRERSPAGHDVRRLAVANAATGRIYQADLDIREDRVVGLRLRTSPEQGITVTYDSPWTRPRPGQAVSRDRLDRADLLDAFDETAWRTLAAGEHVRSIQARALVLHDLAQHGNGMHWEEFRNMPVEERQRYLFSARSEGHLTQWAIGQSRPALESGEERALRARLWNPDDMGVPGAVSARLVGHVDDADIEATISAVDFLSRQRERLSWSEFVASDEAVRTRTFSQAEASGRMTPLDVARTMRVIARLRQQDAEPESPLGGDAAAGPSRR